MDIKKALIDNKNNIPNKNSLLIKQKFSNMFINARDHLEETRAGLHASAIIASDSDFCYRAQVLSLIYQQSQGKDLPVSTLAIFSAGNSIHEKWQSMFEKSSGNLKNFYLIKNEARSFDERYELYFTPDSIIELNNKLYVVEIKSMNTYSYQHAIKSSNPHPSARKQLQFYMYLTGIRNGIILIEDKNTQQFEVFEIEFNYKEILMYIDRLNEIMKMKKDYLELEIDPPRICSNPTTKKALSCSMRDACFECGNGRCKL